MCVRSEMTNSTGADMDMEYNLFKSTHKKILK